MNKDSSIEEIESHIYKKFDILERKGKGAYGVVWKAKEKTTNKIVALKKVFDAFHNDTDAQRTFREIMLLQELNHENIIKLRNVIRAQNNKDIYLVFEFMEIDLHHVNRSNILQDIHKVYIIYQIVKSLKYLHSAEIIHRDLKPANIMLDAECNVKVIDFGLARSIQSYDDEGAPVMTDYVATRWYRAPEIVLGSNQYSKSVDMWSVGCILGELLNGKAIFPGKSTINQVELIIKLLGKPTREELKMANSAADFGIIESMGTKKKYSFSHFFKGASKHALDFLRKTLCYNPDNRLSAEEALRHPFLSQFHNPEEEVVCDKIIKLPISDTKKLNLREYREALYQDILDKKVNQRKKARMKKLQDMGISTGVSKDEAQTKELAKDRRRARERERNGSKQKTYGGSRKSSGYGNYKPSEKYSKYADYKKSSVYKSSKSKIDDETEDSEKKYGYKYYKGASSKYKKRGV